MILIVFRSTDNVEAWSHAAIDIVPSRELSKERVLNIFSRSERRQPAPREEVRVALRDLREHGVLVAVRGRLLRTRLNKIE